MKQVTIYTDGACSGNPGIGGWGAMLQYGAHTKEICGAERHTTNNRMEIYAAIAALRLLKEPCDVSLYSDSAYLVNAFNQGWIYGWMKNNWVKKDKKPVENQDLWKDLFAAMAIHNVHYYKVKGHADNPHNNRCDQLATQCIKQFRHEQGK